MLFYFIALIFIVKASARDLPSYFPKCKLNDKKLNVCLLNAANSLKSRILNGVKEIRLPAFDPLLISFSIQQETDNFKLNITFTNGAVYGFESYRFETMTYDPKTLTLRGNVKFNNIFGTTEYDVNAWILYFPLIGKGSAEIEYPSINGSFEVNGLLINHKGTDYYHPTSVKVRMKLNNGFQVHLRGLFDNNPELGHLTNELLNSNSLQIADYLTPSLEKLVEGVLIHFIRTLTKLVPYNKIFSVS